MSGAATLSLTAAPGALLFLDEARVAALRSPFVRVPLPAGAHVLRLSDGASSDVVARVTFAPGDDAVLVPVGPTLSLHAMRDALAVRTAGPDEGGDEPFRRALEARLAPGGLNVVAAVLLVWLLAVGVWQAVQPSLAAPPPLSALASAAAPALLGPVLLLRASFFFPSALHTDAVVAIAGAALVLGATWRALPYDGLARWMAFSPGALAGLVLIALGLLGARPALGVVAAGGLAVAALHLTHARGVLSADEVERDARLAVQTPALLAVPERLGGLLASMEHGVVGAVARAVSGSLHAVAWSVAAVDRIVVAAPAERFGAAALRASRGLSSLMGVGPGWVAWAFIAVLGIAAALHAVWAGG